MRRIQLLTITGAVLGLLLLTPGAVRAQETGENEEVLEEAERVLDESRGIEAGTGNEADEHGTTEPSSPEAERGINDALEEVREGSTGSSSGGTGSPGVTAPRRNPGGPSAGERAAMMALPMILDMILRITERMLFTDDPAERARLEDTLEDLENERDRLEDVANGGGDDAGSEDGAGAGGDGLDGLDEIEDDVGPDGPTGDEPVAEGAAPGGSTGGGGSSSMGGGGGGLGSGSSSGPGSATASGDEGSGDGSEDGSTSEAGDLSELASGGSAEGDATEAEPEEVTVRGRVVLIERPERSGEADRLGDVIAAGDEEAAPADGRDGSSGTDEEPLDPDWLRRSFARIDDLVAAWRGGDELPSGLSPGLPESTVEIPADPLAELPVEVWLIDRWRAEEDDGSAAGGAPGPSATIGEDGSRGDAPRRGGRRPVAGPGEASVPDADAGRPVVRYRCKVSRRIYRQLVETPGAEARVRGIRTWRELPDELADDREEDDGRLAELEVDHVLVVVEDPE